VNNQPILKLTIAAVCEIALLVHMYSFEPSYKHPVSLLYTSQVEAKLNDEPWNNNPAPPSIERPLYYASGMVPLQLEYPQTASC
jgi:hypothetical protein